MAETLSEGEKTSLAVLIGVFLIPVAMLFALPLTGFCAWCDMLVWNWFGAPYFRLQPISFWTCLALGMLYQMSKAEPFLKKDRESIWKGVGAVILGHLLMLCSALLIVHFTAR